MWSHCLICLAHWQLLCTALQEILHNDSLEHLIQKVKSISRWNSFPFAHLQVYVCVWAVKDNYSVITTWASCIDAWDELVKKDGLTFWPIKVLLFCGMNTPNFLDSLFLFMVARLDQLSICIHSCEFQWKNWSRDNYRAQAFSLLDISPFMAARLHCQAGDDWSLYSEKFQNLCSFHLCGPEFFPFLN